MFVTTHGLETHNQPSHSRLESCGGIRHLALLACLALKMNYRMADMDCDKCGLPHVSGVRHFRPRTRHACSSCGHVFVTSNSVICNLLLPFLQAESRFGLFSELSVLELSDVE